MKNAIVCIIGLVLVVSVSAEPLFEERVRLEAGEPVADAQVRIFDLSDLRRGAIARALTDGTGYFALPLAALTKRALPERFALGPNYPNPFNPSTIIPYQLAASSEVRLEVFNLLGQHIVTLVEGERPAGFHTATWHATDGAGRAVGAGVYIYRMTVGVESQTGRMVLLDGQAGRAAGGAASVMPGASGLGGSNGEGAQVYGLVVSGSGLVPYVDSSFRVEAGMAPVELVVSSGHHSAGKATDDDCAFCDLFDTFNDQQEEEEDETPEEEEETDSTSSEGGPDLIVQSPSVSAVMLTPGQEFTLNVTVHNQGDEQAAATMLHYYRSNNATITSSDTEVGTDAVGALDASATSAASITLTEPTSVNAEVGIYYGACVASVSGESNTDNNCSSAVKITVSGHEAPEDETPEEDEETPEEDEETPEEDEADDLPADTTTPGVVEVDGSVTGTIGTAGDIDWFAVTLAEDTTYIIKVYGSRSDPGPGPLLRGIYDATGSVVAPADSDAKLKPGPVVFSPGADGIYYLAVSRVGESTGSYTLRVEASADIPADTTTNAIVYVNNGRWGYIETPDDKDWFVVTLEAGTSYRIDLMGGDYGIGELVDTRLLSIRDATGAAVANTEADGGGIGQDARFDFVPATSGTYYIEAGSSNGSTGYYVVRLAADDYVADRKTVTLTLQDGSVSVTGTIERSYDEDWFKVTLEKGTSYWIYLEGSTTGAGTLDETSLKVILPDDETSEFIAFTSNGEGGNSQFHFTAQSNDPYYLVAKAGDNGTGTYTLSVRAQAEETDLPADTDTDTDTDPDTDTDTDPDTDTDTEPEPLSFVATGVIDTFDDEDRFAVTLRAGRTYRMEAKGEDTGDGTLGDPRLYVLIYQGELLFPAGPQDHDSGTGRNASLTYTPTADGTVYLVVSGDGGTYGTTGSYTVTVTEIN